MENSYLNIATNKAYSAADMRAAYKAGYLPAVAAGYAPMTFSAWLDEITASGDYIAVPARAGGGLASRCWPAPCCPASAAPCTA